MFVTCTLFLVLCLERLFMCALVNEPIDFTKRIPSRKPPPAAAIVRVCVVLIRSQRKLTGSRWPIINEPCASSDQARCCCCCCCNIVFVSVSSSSLLLHHHTTHNPQPTSQSWLHRCVSLWLRMRLDEQYPRHRHHRLLLVCGMSRIRARPFPRSRHNAADYCIKPTIEA
jgi:hypothetical protein